MLEAKVMNDECNQPKFYKAIKEHLEGEEIGKDNSTFSSASKKSKTTKISLNQLKNARKSVNSSKSCVQLP
jgi:hypothetical protein